MKATVKASLLIAAILLIAVPVAGAQSARKDSYAGVGFMALSPNLTDTIASFQIEDTLFGGSVSFAVNPWFSIGADVLYLGDIYYGEDAEGFFGPVSWTKLNKRALAPPATRTAAFYESIMYAPLTFNLTIPMGFLVPYLGAGPAFYFHFPSTNTDSDFADYLKRHYGDGQRIRTGLTARAGLQISLSESFALGAGYVLREDIPSNLFADLGNQAFYLENGYAFVVARMLFR